MDNVQNCDSYMHASNLRAKLNIKVMEKVLEN
jgi:hypothetical protein